jgi:hypothetical protein
MAPTVFSNDDGRRHVEAYRGVGKAVVLECDRLPKIDPLLGADSGLPWVSGSWIVMGLCRNRPAVHRRRPRAGFESFHSHLTGRSTSMARKREPLVIDGGVIVDLDASGLHIVRRSNGRVDQLLGSER